MAASGPVTVTTPLGPTALVFRSMQGVEALGRPFEYVIDLVSDDPNIELTDLLGQTMAVHLELADGEQRHFHGFITSVDFVETLGSATSYRAVVRPWLSLLANTTNCRIFQNQSVPDIVKQVFRDHGFTDFEDSLTEDYPKAEYVVQYRESDFNFVSRLLEHAGVYYYFRHAAAAHTLVLSDSRSAHHPTPGAEQLPFRPPDPHRTRLFDCVDAWQLRQAMTSGKVALRDFDFERPRADLSAMASAPKDHAHADFEVYDYPGDYRVKADGETQARVRLEQRQGPFARTCGHTNARAFTSGALFTLAEHPRADQNKEYLIVFARLSITGHDVGSGTADAELTFSSDFDAIDSRLPFRTAPTTRKPVVEGPQTAMVVGKSGAEIWTDKYGRIKVQFHWDRDGKSDENSSCWVRVSEAWAGPGWGSMHLPHSGQEVIVSFLEGDPDRPIVTGRVYDGTNMPWQALPAQQKKSYFRDEGNNHIMMDATKGKERIEFSTPYAKTKLSLGAPNSPDGVNLETDANLTATIAKDAVEKTGGNKELWVDGESRISILKDFNEEIKGNIDKLCHGSVKVNVGSFKNEVTVGASTDIFIGLKHESFFGYKTEVSRSKSFKFVYAKEVGKNYAELEEWAKGHVRKVSEESYVISVGESGGMLHLDTETAILSVEGISIRVDGKTKKIIIKAEDEIRVKAKKLKVTTEEDVTINSKNTKINIDGGSFDVASQLKVLP